MSVPLLAITLLTGAGNNIEITRATCLENSYIYK